MKKFLYCSNYCWRVFATGISFLIFGLGGIFLSYVIFPFINLLTPDQYTKGLRAQHAISIAFRLFTFIVQSFGLIEFDFKNFKNLENIKGHLIISNHPTLIDYVVIVSKLKHCDIIVKEKLFNNFFIKKVLRLANYIPNTQSIETFERIKSALAAGGNVLIFPEGTRSEPQQPLKLQRGAANIAVRTAAPIQIIHIHSSPSSLSKNCKWYKIPKKKIQFCAEVGETVSPEIFLQQTKAPSAAARRLTRHLKFELEKGLAI